MFETQRLILRRYRPSDDELLFALFDEYPVLLGITSGYVVPNLESHKARLETMLRCLLFVVIEEKETKAFVGFTLLNQTTGPLNRDAEVGIALTSTEWGKGYGTEILTWLTRYAFEGMALHRLSLLVWSSNVSAIKLYEKLGFEREGCIRESAWKEGKFVDKILMGLLAREYRQRNASPHNEE